ncbi:MAG: hypothetical protein ACO3NL_10785, partial [Phycisphaerales bacterium]
MGILLARRIRLRHLDPVSTLGTTRIRRRQRRRKHDRFRRTTFLDAAVDDAGEPRIERQAGEAACHGPKSLDGASLLVLDGLDGADLAERALRLLDSDGRRRIDPRERFDRRQSPMREF